MKKVYQVIEDFISDDGESVIESCDSMEKAVKALESYMGDSERAWIHIGENHYEWDNEDYEMELYIVERSVK